MTSPGMAIRLAKERGEWAELRFMTRATELGFRVAKPWGDCAPYDVATDHHGRFCRVQVKCTIQKRWNSYRCGLAANGVPYTPDQIDFIAAYVIPSDTWYILPSVTSKACPKSSSTPTAKMPGTTNTKKPGPSSNASGRGSCGDSRPRLSVERKLDSL